MIAPTAVDELKVFLRQVPVTDHLPSSKRMVAVQKKLALAAG
jgi:hypothetical protein